MENNKFTPEKLRQVALSGLVTGVLGIICLLGYKAHVSEQQKLIAQCGSRLEHCDKEQMYIPHFDGRMSVETRYVTQTPTMEVIP